MIELSTGDSLSNLEDVDSVVVSEDANNIQILMITMKKQCMR